MQKNKRGQLAKIFRFSRYLLGENLAGCAFFIGIAGIECDSGIHPLGNMAPIHRSGLMGGSRIGMIKVCP